MSNLNPLISIMIPTFNRADRLMRAVESAVNQSYSLIEVLISDNASKDGTNSYLESIADSRVKFFQQEKNIGLIGNWNFLAKRANGDYCLMLSDDDELDSHAIRNLLAAMQQSELRYNDIHMIIGSSTISRNIGEENDYSIVTSTCGELMQRVLRNEVQVLPSATLFKTTYVRKNGYREYYGAAIDLGLIADMAKENCVAVSTNKMVCKYNIHADNTTSKFDIDEIYKTYRRLHRVAYSCGDIGVSYHASLNVFMRKILGYVIAERYSADKVALLPSLKYIMKYDGYFKLEDYFLIPSKMFAKKFFRK